MEQLRLIEEANVSGLIKEAMYKKIVSRFRYVREGIERVERASGIRYPPYYIEPSMILSTSALEFGSVGILFARTIPLVQNDKLNIIIQITAPLLAFGLKGTIHAIIAHEFLHYLELVAKLIRMNTLSDEISATLFESTYSDLTHLLNPRAVFNDNSLLRLIQKKFPDGLHDPRLEDKAVKLWLEKDLPAKRISMEDNIARLPMNALINTKIAEELEEKVNRILAKEIKPRRKSKSKI